MGGGAAGCSPPPPPPPPKKKKKKKKKSSWIILKFEIVFFIEIVSKRVGIQSDIIEILRVFCVCSVFFLLRGVLLLLFFACQLVWVRRKDSFVCFAFQLIWIQGLDNPPPPPPPPPPIFLAGTPLI